ncbi:hypothetical protein FOL46_000440, partial [Perkinsus olseni]
MAVADIMLTPAITNLLLLFGGSLPWTLLAIRSRTQQDTNLIVNATQLDYRCALPSDNVTRIERLTDDSTDFVAVDPTAAEGEPVVGSLEYALISRENYGEWVYIDAVDIKKGWPELDGAFLLVKPFNPNSPQNLYKKIGFVYKGKSAHYDGFADNLPTDLPPTVMRLPTTNDYFVVDTLHDLFDPVEPC